MSTKSDTTKEGVPSTSILVTSWGLDPHMRATIHTHMFTNVILTSTTNWNLTRKGSYVMGLKPSPRYGGKIKGCALDYAPFNIYQSRPTRDSQCYFMLGIESLVP